MTDPDNDRLRNRVARLLLLASEARVTGRHAAADQFTERAAELIRPECERRPGGVVRQGRRMRSPSNRGMVCEKRKA